MTDEMDVDAVGDTNMDDSKYQPRFNVPYVPAHAPPVYAAAHVPPAAAGGAWASYRDAQARAQPQARDAQRAAQAREDQARAAQRAALAREDLAREAQAQAREARARDAQRAALAREALAREAQTAALAREAQAREAQAQAREAEAQARVAQREALEREALAREAQARAQALAREALERAAALERAEALARARAEAQARAQAQDESIPQRSWGQYFKSFIPDFSRWTMAGGSALPETWNQAVDATGRIYYYNTVTGERVWADADNDDAAPQPAAAAAKAQKAAAAEEAANLAEAERMRRSEQRRAEAQRQAEAQRRAAAAAAGGAAKAQYQEDPSEAVNAFRRQREAEENAQNIELSEKDIYRILGLVPEPVTEDSVNRLVNAFREKFKHTYNPLKDTFDIKTIKLNKIKLWITPDRVLGADKDPFIQKQATQIYYFIIKKIKDLGNFSSLGKRISKSKKYSKKHSKRHSKKH